MKYRSNKYGNDLLSSFLYGYGIYTALDTEKANVLYFAAKNTSDEHTWFAEAQKYANQQKLIFHFNPIDFLKMFFAFFAKENLYPRIKFLINLVDTNL